MNLWLRIVLVIFLVGVVYTFSFIGPVLLSEAYTKDCSKGSSDEQQRCKEDVIGKRMFGWAATLGAVAMYFFYFGRKYWRKTEF